jgi:hypothetical protein
MDKIHSIEMRLAKSQKETNSHSMYTLHCETKIVTVAVCKINRKIAIISKEIIKLIII